MLWVAPLVLALIAILWWRTHVSAQIGFETVPVEAGSVQALVTATGTLNPVVNVQVGSQVSGNIKALYADFNTKVKKGQLVALIDPDIFQAQVDQAEAAAASASSAVVTAGAQIEKAQSDVSGSRANRDNLLALAAKDRANFINAKMEWQRADMLFRNRVYSAEQHDSAKAAYDSAQAQLAADQSQIDAANHNIQSAEAQVRVAQTQLATARAQQRQAEATLVQTKINLKHTRIVAPVSGTVIARHFDVGQTVAASFQAPDIFDIAQDLTRMQVDTNVDESDVGDIRNGQPVTFTVDAYPGTIFRGAVSDVRKAPISAQNVVTYDVVINLSNPDLKLFPGMTANVSIETAREDNALKVANAALRFHPTSELASRQKLPALVPGSPQLYVLSGSKITLVPVECGITDGKFTVVSGSQLKSGDQAIVRAITANSSNATTQTTPTPRLPRM
jgi:HlyD family secretion protein